MEPGVAQCAVVYFAASGLYHISSTGGLFGPQSHTLKLRRAELCFTSFIPACPAPSSPRSISPRSRTTSRVARRHARRRACWRWSRRTRTATDSCARRARSPPPTASAWSSSIRRCGCARRDTRSRIVLLEGVFEPSELPVIAQHGDSHGGALPRAGRHAEGLPADAALDVFVKVNTGMNRLGFEPGASSRRSLAELKRAAGGTGASR